jgi:hypothetical protein
MASFTVTITDPAHLAGITAAREAKNAALNLDEGQAREGHPDYIATDAAYVQFVMAKAAESYANQYGAG